MASSAGALTMLEADAVVSGSLSGILHLMISQTVKTDEKSHRSFKKGPTSEDFARSYRYL